MVPGSEQSYVGMRLNKQEIGWTVRLQYYQMLFTHTERVFLEGGTHRRIFVQFIREPCIPLLQSVKGSVTVLHLHYSY